MKNKITYKSKSMIITKEGKKYLKKIKKKNKEELYEYLRNKDFQNYLPYITVADNYEIYPFIEDQNIPSEDKAIELMQVLSFLHIKTTTYQELDINKMKTLYETTKEKITYLKNYYYDLQEYLETKVFMSPAEQILMYNISSFHKALNYSEYKLDAWYKLKETQKTERVVQLHNNLSLDHFLKDDIPYLVNWDKSTKDYVIFDFLNFYQNEFLNLEMTKLFELYQTKYQYTEDEKLLLEALISIPPKVTFLKSNYINTIETRKIITYVEKTNEFLLKNNKENEESNK